ncbi:hypothetical protein MMC25_005651 [Agyrium rufum]|nr:hypothetical protein [Agyrium rufum]
MDSAGVTGLTTALQLARAGKSKYDITVVAKFMPGDFDVEYASNLAGANYLPVSLPGTDAAQHDRDTWPALEKLAKHHPESGVHFQEYYQYNNTARDSNNPGKNVEELLKPDPWFKDTTPNFRILDAKELPPTYDSGSAFTSVCINTSLYLHYIYSQCLALGVIVKRGIVKHISDAAAMHASGKQAELVVNCTGLSSYRLGGVEDKTMYPIRGQTVLVRNDPGMMCSTSGTEEGEGEMCYIMQRAAGGGTILGGCYQVGNWDSQVDANLSMRIMRRAVEVCPALTGGKGIDHLSVIRQNVGLRPARKDGVRLEREQIGGDGGVWCVHNYGHAGWGYQSSYGCAKVAVRLVGEALGD